MQLTIEVLPAPFGPMMENSSPSLTPKETSVSARTPPKRSDTARTSKAFSKHLLRCRDFRVKLARPFGTPPIRLTAGGLEHILRRFFPSPRRGEVDSHRQM